MTVGWLSLIEYRNKYGVSLSTLRRRIKGNGIEFQQIRGKYFVKDELIETNREVVPYFNSSIGAPAKEGFIENKTEQKDEMPEKAKVGKATPPSGDQMALMLAEIKTAYQSVLKEKEEQIFLLKEEIANLHTLTRILEDENLRLKGVNP